MDQRENPGQAKKKKNPGSVHVGFVVYKVALGQVFFPPEYLGFPLSISFHLCSITRKNEKKKLIIFITGLHNKPLRCGASVASAAGPFTTKKIKLVAVLLALIIHKK
jgi:hypothetical protein